MEEKELSNESKIPVLDSGEDDNDKKTKDIMMEDIENKMLEGYERISIEELKKQVKFEIVKPKYLPEGFENYGIFIRENPGMPNKKMINQLWYDLETNEVLMVIQMDGAPVSFSEGDILFTEKLESQGTINDVYSWAKYRLQYEFIENEISIQGYMLVNDINNRVKYEEILKSLKS